jgi:hypothetical protein
MFRDFPNLLLDETSPPDAFGADDLLGCPEALRAHERGNWDGVGDEWPEDSHGRLVRPRAA